MADQTPEPDFSQDPRGHDVGQGYPEAQAGTDDDAIDKGAYPDSSEHGGTEGSGPSTSSKQDEDPRRASGNERAAG